MTLVVSVLALMGALALTEWDDPAPWGETGPSLPEPPSAETAALASALGTETVGFRVAPEVVAMEAASPSAVTPLRAPRLEGDWSPVCWPLVCTITSTVFSPL